MRGPLSQATNTSSNSEHKTDDGEEEEIDWFRGASHVLILITLAAVAVGAWRWALR